MAKPIKTARAPWQDEDNEPLNKLYSALKGSGPWVGKSGDQLRDLPVTVTNIYCFPCAARPPLFYVRMETAKGAVIVWKTTSWSRVAPGKKGVLSGVVRGREVYDGQNRTIVYRCKLREAARG